MNQSAALMCRQYGLSVSELARISKVSVRTLYSWHAKRPEVFSMLILAAVTIKHRQLTEGLIK